MTISKLPLLCAPAVVLAILIATPARAQSPPVTKNAALEQELVHTEYGFFEAWKSKDLAYFRNHIADNGVFFDENGTATRDQQLEQQQAAAKNCTIDGYGLSDFGLLPISAGVYLLTYKAEQYATCSGQKIPAHINGSSVYVFKQGRWQAVYRAAVPLKNQN